MVTYVRNICRHRYRFHRDARTATMPPHTCYMSSTREESAQVLSRLKCKARTAAVGRGEGSETQEMIADEQFETTKPHTCGMANDRRTQLQPKIRTYTYLGIYYLVLPSGNTAQKLPTQQTGGTSSDYRRTKGGSHESLSLIHI